MFNFKISMRNWKNSIFVSYNDYAPIKFVMNRALFQKKIVDIQRNMFSFAMMLTANTEEAEDLLQDTTLKVLNHQDMYVENNNFKAWVMTIMRNIFINNYRKVIRNQTIFDQTEDLYHLNLPQDSGFDSPEAAFTIKEINQAINALDSELKIPFSLYLAGYKYEEIAGKLNIPLGTVKSRIFIPRNKLQKALKGMR